MADGSLPDRRVSYPLSDHFDGKRFFNPTDSTQRGLREVFKWRRTRQVTPWPRWIENKPHPAPQRAHPTEVSATFIGHASFLLQIGGLTLLTDPVYSRRVSPLSFAGPKRVRAPGQPLHALPDIDILLISHNHYDHLDLATVRDVQARWAPPVVTGLGTGRTIAKATTSRIAELDWWETTVIGEARITYVPAQHFAARTPFDRNKALWGGFVIEVDGATVYFAGDSGYCPHFAEIGRRFPSIDLALIPIGAYEPRWFMRPMHMDPEEAVMAHRDLGARKSIGMHFGTFADLTDEPIDAPESELQQARRFHGVAEDAFITLDFGETHAFAVR